MQLSYYDISQKNSNPRTKVFAHVDENGITHFYEVDYGDYKLKAKLRKVEFLKEKKC